MVVPNDVDGYTLFSKHNRDVNKEIPTYTTKLLFQHKTKQFYHLYDRLLMVSPALKFISDYIKNISHSWYVSFRGKILNLILKRFLLFVDNKQQFGYFGDYVLSANYSQVTYYVDNIIGVLKHNYGLEDKYYHTKIDKKDLHYLSKVFAGEMIPLCLELLPKYRRLTSTRDL